MAEKRTRGLLDISTVILMRRLTDPAALPDEIFISAVTLAELSVGPLVATTEQERAVRQAHHQQEKADFEALPFDSASARAFGRVAASLRSPGHKVTARTFDAMIAATAVANRLPLYTCKPDDFSGVAGLEVIVFPVPV